MKKINLLFISFLFSGLLMSQELKIPNAVVAEGVNRSALYNYEHYGIDTTGHIEPGDTVAYVRPDGKVLLNPVSRGSTVWSIHYECKIEDSLTYMGAWNYEATMALNAKCDRIIMLTGEINKLAKISNSMRTSTTQIKESESQKKKTFLGKIGLFTVTVIVIFGALFLIGLSDNIKTWKIFMNDIFSTKDTPQNTKLPRL